VTVFVLTVTNLRFYTALEVGAASLSGL